MTHPPKNHWPAAILAGVLAFVAFLAVTLYWGITRTSRVSDPEYYLRGAGYGRQLLAEQAGRQRWTLEVRVVSGNLLARLHDETGRPVSNAAGTLSLSPSSAAPPSVIALEAGADGTYRAALPPLPPTGRRAVVEVRREEIALRRSLLLLP